MRETGKANTKLVEVSETVEVIRCDMCRDAAPTERTRDGSFGLGLNGLQFQHLANLDGWFIIRGPIDSRNQVFATETNLELCPSCSGSVLDFIKTGPVVFKKADTGA